MYDIMSCAVDQNVICYDKDAKASEITAHLISTMCTCLLKGVSYTDELMKIYYNKPCYVHENVTGIEYIQIDEDLTALYKSFDGTLPGGQYYTGLEQDGFVILGLGKHGGSILGSC